MHVVFFLWYYQFEGRIAMKKSLISITAAFVIAAGMMPVTGLGGQSLFGPVYAAEGSDTAAEIAEQFADPEQQDVQ